VRVVFAGTPEVALPSLRALARSTHEVVGVVTRPDARAGRGRSLQPSPVKELATALGLPVLTPDSPREPGFRESLAALAPDVCAVVAYGALLPPDLLEVPTHGWINLHFSLLPAWRGAAPVQRAIIAGDELSGASTFRIESGLDTGPVFGIMTEGVRPTDTAGTLLARLAEAGSGLLVATLDGIADGSLVARDQPTDGVCLAPKLTVEEAEVSWSRPALAIDRLIRGCTPEPGAWTTFRGERLGLGPIDLLEHDAATLPPGRLLADKRSVLVGTASGPVRLGSVRPAGKKEMAAADWARGVRIGVGEVLGG
jgi:methionyl-tRNA formyltransferase